MKPHGAIEKAIRAGHEAAGRLHASGLVAMTPAEVLSAVAALLPGSTLAGSYLYVCDQLVACAGRHAVIVTAAYVFDGHQERCQMPDSVTTPAHHRDPVGRVLEAIEARQKARAMSKPAPTPGPSRSPEECHAP